MEEPVPAEPRKVDNYPRCLGGVGSDAYTLHALGLDGDGAETALEHRVGEFHDNTRRISEHPHRGRSLVFGRDLNVDAATAYPRHTDRFERGSSRGRLFRSLGSRERYDAEQR